VKFSMALPIECCGSRSIAVASLKQESRAVARKLRDAAAVLFGLKFADNSHYKFKSIAKIRKPCFRAPNIPA